MNSHRQRARKRTVVWQAGSLALLAGAIGMGAIPLTRALGPGNHQTPVATEATKPKVGPDPMSAGSVIALVKALNDIAPNKPVTVVTTDDGTKPEDTTPVAVEPTPVVAPTAWAYTGYMAGRNAKRAIITIGAAESSQQVSLAEGDKHQETKLVEIQPDHITIEDAAGVQKRVDLATRTAASNWNMDQPHRPAAARPGQPGMNGMPTMTGMTTAPGMASPSSGFGTPSAATMMENQRRAKAAAAGNNGLRPPVVDERTEKLDSIAKDIGVLTEDKKNTLTKIMLDPGLTAADREKMLRGMGIPTEMNVEERERFYQNIGVNPDTDPKLYNFIRESGGK